MSPIKLNDMFFGECKRGTYAQTYDRRAGTWVPGYYYGQVEGGKLLVSVETGKYVEKLRGHVRKPGDTVQGLMEQGS